jgi:hypothetical protein
MLDISELKESVSFEGSDGFAKDPWKLRLRMVAFMAAAQSEDSKARQKVAEYPDTPAIVLITLAQDPDESVRLAAAEHPNFPYSLLPELASDPSADLRLALAENHSMPVSILRQLSGDENPYVACRAQETLKYNGAVENLVDATDYLNWRRRYKTGTNS